MRPAGVSLPPLVPRTFLLCAPHGKAKGKGRRRKSGRRTKRASLALELVCPAAGSRWGRGRNEGFLFWPGNATAPVFTGAAQNRNSVGYLRRLSFSTTAL